MTPNTPADVASLPELLPCPFCGHEVVTMYGREYFACVGCGAFGPSAKHEAGESPASRAERARELWNNRAALAEPASGDGLPADDGETLRLLDARKDDALCREAADLIRRLTTPSQPGSAVQGEADEAAMEAWHSAVEEAGELYVNAPDSRYANRARRVKAWIVSQRPRVHRSGN